MGSPSLIAATIGAALLIGFLSTFLESVHPALARRLRSEPQAFPSLSRWVHLSWVVLMPLTGWMIDGWGVHGILFAGSLTIAVGVAWTGVAQSKKSLVWTVLALGWGGAAVTLSGLRLMADAFPVGPRPTPEGSLCVGFVFIGAAALVTQSLYARLVDRLGFRNTLLFSALVCLAPAGIVALGDGAAFPGPQPDTTVPAALHNPRLWLLLLGIFFFFAVEHSLDIWPRPYLTELGYSGRAQIYILIVFWLCFLGSRLALGWVFRPEYEFWLVFAISIIPPMVLGNLAGAYAPSSGTFGFWTVGLCYGPLLPAFLGIALQLFDKQAWILGVLLGIDSLCVLLIQPWLNAYIKSHTARQAMRFPLFFGLLLSGVLLVLALIRHS